MQRCYYQATGRAASAAEIRSALDLLEARAQRHRRNRVASSVPIMIRASEPPMKLRLCIESVISLCALTHPSISWVCCARHQTSTKIIDIVRRLAMSTKMLIK
jgi:hypothetical protein